MPVGEEIKCWGHETNGWGRVRAGGWRAGGGRLGDPWGSCGQVGRASAAGGAGQAAVGRSVGPAGDCLS